MTSYIGFIVPHRNLENIIYFERQNFIVKFWKIEFLEKDKVSI